ncbi:MAG TPA: alpha/beta hydrolase [Candidatus Dormibacteraeota bacterium]|jgi:dienelactone hydrolase|nr:alpha/beta hydrolase [Candidatus Dormibacteraeota bacterium]
MELTDSAVSKQNFFVVFFILTIVLAASEVLAQQAPQAASSPAHESSSAASPAIKPSAPPSGLDPKTRIPLYETIQEDWSSLEIGASKLQPETPLVGEVDEQSEFTRLLVQVKWRPGDPIDLWIILPKGTKKPPAVLYLYNADQNLSRFRDDRWCGRATSGGVAAVGFVAALSGARFHDRPLKQWFVSELQESIGSTVHDVKFILDYLAQRGEVDMNRIGMFGEGSGGTIAILAAAAEPRIKAVDALDPWGDWPDFLARSPVVLADPNHDDYLKPEFLRKVVPLDPVKWLPQLKVPVRIQQVRQNDSTPIESKNSIQAAAPKQAEMKRFEAASDLAAREGHGILFRWIKDRLQESDKPGADAGPGAAAAAGKTPLTEMENDHPSHR